MGVQLTDTTLRDAHQSLIATRMRTRDILSVIEKMDRVGFFSLEVWGGATFDTCIRFLNEDPWERLRQVRDKAKHTRLQMLLRGQNVVGYRHYADDVLNEFIRLSVKNGIDVFRIFDALNDTRNMEPSIRIAKSRGAHVQGAICYTISPVHTVESFVQLAITLADLGCDSICIKDMAGLISPPAAAELIKGVKAKVSIPVDLHSHCSSGMAPMSYQAAGEAGADIMDTAFSALAWGTSQPPTESVAAAFKDTPYDTGYDLQLLYEIGEEVADITAKYRVLFTAEATRVNINALIHQIPGGMLSNLVSQLREQKALDRLKDVMEEIPRVRADMGYPPLVTPTSQIVGIQAVLNVLAGGRYKQVSGEVRDYMLGKYGRPPAPINEEIRKVIIGSEKPLNVRPAEVMPVELGKLSEEANKLGIIKKEEDLITYALYPQVATKFLRGELKEESIPTAIEPAKTSAPVTVAPMEFAIDVDGEVFTVKISPVGGKPTTEMERAKPKEAPEGAVVAPMQGMVLTVKVKPGDKVIEGDVLLIIEAMKMRNDVRSPFGGLVKEVLTHDGEVVATGDVLMVIDTK
ncbi:MAG: pyruvate/oxaloacetate carboxyltransferase [Chloroflexota bacterium]